MKRKYNKNSNFNIRNVKQCACMCVMYPQYVYHIDECKKTEAQ